MDDDFFRKIGKNLHNSRKKSTSKTTSKTSSKQTNSNSQSSMEKAIKKLPAISKIIIVFLFILGVATSFFVCKFICRNDCFEINGKKSFSLSVGETYTDEGVTVIGFGQDLTTKVTVKVFKDGEELSGLDQIDTSQEAVYQILYTVNSFRFKEVELIRTVTVVSDQTEDYEEEEESYNPLSSQVLKVDFQQYFAF